MNDDGGYWDVVVDDYVGYIRAMLIIMIMFALKGLLVIGSWKWNQAQDGIVVITLFRKGGVAFGCFRCYNCCRHASYRNMRIGLGSYQHEWKKLRLDLSD